LLCAPPALPPPPPPPGPLLPAEGQRLVAKMLAASGEADTDAAAYADRMMADPQTKKILLEQLEARLAELAAARKDGDQA